MNSVFLVFLLASQEPLQRALDAQDRAALEKLAAKSTAAPDVARAQSFLSQVAIELGDKAGAGKAAEAGIVAARKAVEGAPKNAEYHRLLGTLCGQVIPANVMAGMKYGRCALDEVNKAIELDPKSAQAYVSRGVGNYYLPAMLGGGVDKAIADLRKAIQLDPKSHDAHLWLGIALRKAGKNPEARQSITKALELNPDRKWAQQQLAKTPK